MFINQIAYQFTLEGADVFVENYKYPIMMIGIGFLIHFIPDRLADKFIERQKHFPILYHVVVLFLFIFLYSNFKSAESVMPIYLQF